MNNTTLTYEQEQERRLSADEARLVHMFKALGNPIRFQIVKMLAERQTCITQEIVDATPLAQSTVSQHLKVLRESGLVQGEVEGPATCYCLNSEGIRWLKTQIEEWLPGCCESGNVQRLELLQPGKGSSCC